MFNKLQTSTKDSEKIVLNRLEGPGAMVFNKFMFQINRMNIISGTPDQLCSRWKLTTWEFRKGIEELKKNNIIRKYTAKEYMINPDIVYNGDDRQYYIIKTMWDNQTSSGLKSNELCVRK